MVLFWDLLWALIRDGVDSVEMVIFGMFQWNYFNLSSGPKAQFSIAHGIHTRDGSFVGSSAVQLNMHVLYLGMLGIQLGIVLGYRRLKWGQIRLMIVAFESFEAFIILLKSKTWRRCLERNILKVLRTLKTQKVFTEVSTRLSM